MSWIAVAVVASTAISVGMQYAGSKKAAKGAKAAAEEEAKYEKILTDERLRQLDIEERAAKGSTLAGYAGSGVQAIMPGLMGRLPSAGSPATILAEQKKEFGFERKVTQEAGASRVASSLQRGKSTADYYRYQGYASIAGGVSDIVNMWAVGAFDKPKT